MVGYKVQGNSIFKWLLPSFRNISLPLADDESPTQAFLSKLNPFLEQPLWFHDKFVSFVTKDHNSER